MSQSGKQVSNINNIFGGGARFVYADAGTAKPTQLSDLLTTSTGALVSGWNDFGATDGGARMRKGFEKETWEVDQVLGVIDEFITQWTMMLETNLAESSLENLQIAWEEGSITINSTPDPDERSMGMGDPESLTERMFALIVDKRRVSSVGYIRAYIFWRGQIDGSESEHAFVKGQKTLVPIVIKVLADTTETTDRRFGLILDQVPA